MEPQPSVPDFVGVSLGAAVLARFAEAARASAVWRERDDPPRSVPGVGAVVSATLIAELPELGRLSSKVAVPVSGREIVGEVSRKGVLQHAPTSARGGSTHTPR